MTTDVQLLATRVERLERQNHRMKLAGISVLVLVGSGLLMGQAAATKVPKVIMVESIGLVDNARQARGGMRVLPDGTSSLALMDNDGKVGIGLNVATDGTRGLLLMDKGGKVLRSLP